MKNLGINLVSILALAAIICFTGCEDDDIMTIISDQDKTAAYPGENIVLTGQNFNQVQFVFVGYDQTSFQLNGNTLIFMIPEGTPPGMVDVTLAMAGDVRLTTEIEVLLRPIAQIATFDAFVPIGGELTMTGSGFEHDPAVTIGGVPASIVSNTASELVVTVPAGIPDNQPLEIAITTIHGTTTTTTAFIARENLLINSQLNDGTGDDFPGWEKLNGGDGMTEVTGEDAYGGGRSMRVDGPAGNPWDKQLASAPTQLVFGEEYTVILWAKGEEAGGVMRVSASQWDGNGADYFYGADVELSTLWEPYFWTFTVGRDLAEHKIVLDMGTAGVPIMIDHIALMPGSMDLSTEAPDLMVDGGFEGGLPGDDSGWSVFNGDITITTEADELVCGTNGLKAVGAASNPWNTQLASAPLPLEYQKTYEVSFWARAAGPDGVIRVSASRYTDGSDPRSDYFYGHDIPVSEDFTQYSYVFTVETDLAEGHNIMFDMGATGQTFFIDEVTIREYSDEANLIADPGFESGIPGDDTGWAVLNGDVTLSSEDVFEGSNAAKAVGAGSNPWNTQLSSEPLALEIGKRYGIRFNAKAAGPDGVMRVSVSRYTDGSDPRSDYFYGHDLTIAEDWTTYSYNFTVETDLPDGHYIVFDMGSTTQTFYLDQVVVYEIPEVDCDD